MLTLEEAKLHLRVDGTDEDTAIQTMIDAATAASADYLNLPLEELTITAPSPIKAATLLMIGDLYENRESQADRQLYGNMTYHRLLNPYRAVTL